MTFSVVWEVSAHARQKKEEKKKVPSSSYL